MSDEGFIRAELQFSVSLFMYWKISRLISRVAKAHNYLCVVFVVFVVFHFRGVVVFCSVVLIPLDLV
jgi:hypothetical protein